MLDSDEVIKMKEVRRLQERQVQVPVLDLSSYATSGLHPGYKWDVTEKQEQYMRDAYRES